MKNATSTILKSVQKYSNISSAVTFVLTAGLTVVLLMIPSLDPSFIDNTTNRIAAMAMTILFGSVAVFILIMMAKKFRDGSPLLDAVEKDAPAPTELEFRKIPVRRGAPAYLLIARFADGKRDQFNYAGKHHEALVADLTQRFPEANITTG